ncbi:MAG: hypothetical protein RLZZ15_1651 [Verrucomicrobiota bacterium]|jgi:hypothetical protein
MNPPSPSRHPRARPGFLRWLALGCAAVAALRGGDSFFDRLHDTLSVSSPDAHARARLSGAFDFEAYRLPLPAPGVIRSDGPELFQPRLTLFLDAQIGATAYAFAQARYDRGFDPAEAGGRLRLDEYALRLTPWAGAPVRFQVGKFATIVGNWAVRHGGWSDPFVTAPAPYEALTGVWDTEAVRSANQLLQWSHVRPGQSAAVTAIEKDRRLPIVWGPSYAAGAAVSGEVGHFGYAAEVKNASLSSRPEQWEARAVAFDHPTLSARVHWRPSAVWNLGASASTGSYLDRAAGRTVAAGRTRGDYRQTVVAADAAFAWHHWQAWAEVYAARFAIPTLAHADTLSYYVETRYKFTPHLAGAIRWNQQLYGQVPERGVNHTWGRDLWRVDFAPAWRFTPHVQLKLQYSLQRGDAAPRAAAQTWATQLTLRF